MNSVSEWRILQCTNSMFVWDGQSKEDKKDILHVQNREKSFSKEQKMEHFSHHTYRPVILLQRFIF